MPTQTSLAPRSAWAFVWQPYVVTTLCAALIVSVVSALAFAQPRPPQARPVVAWEPTGPRMTWRNISFVVPPGMRGTDRGDLYDMAGKGISGPDGECTILLFGEVPAGSELARQAQDLLVSTLGNFGVKVMNSIGESDLTVDRRLGRSADGWSYVELGGMLAGDQAGRARIMLIVRGATVVPVIALASRGNGCVAGVPGETTAFGNSITWAALYHSLRIAGSSPSTHLREQIVGRWESLSASTGARVGTSQGETYALNGRYAHVGMVGAYGPVSPGGSDFMTQSFTGAGGYVVEGNRLTISPDQGSPQTNLIRIVEDREATAPGRSTVRLCKIHLDVLPYESCRPRIAP